MAGGTRIIDRTLIATGDVKVEGNLKVAGTQTITGAVTFSGNQAIGDADGDAHTMKGTVAGYRALVESVTADDALTSAESGKTFIFADAAATLTLPDSGAGDIIGCSFHFVSNFQGTGQKVVCADTTNEDMIGAISASDNDDSNATKSWPSLVATTNSSVNLNSVAQGHPGSAFTVTNIAADVWYVTGHVIQSGGSEATPFATS
jgi:hypothetical protein